MKSESACDHSNESSTEQYIPMVVFITLYKVVLTFELVDNILNCDRSNKSYRGALSCDSVYYAEHGGSKF